MIYATTPYEMLITVLLEAVKALAMGDLKKFDPLIGENACEIRAIWIATIVSKRLIKFNNLLKRIGNIQERIHKLLQPKAISELMSNGISLMELCKKEKFLIYLSLEEGFIIQCFLLTETKVTISDENSMFSLCIKEKCDPKKIKRFGDISSSSA